MTAFSAQRFLVLALVPLLLLGSLRPSAEAGDAARGGDDVRLELASLKAEARSLTVHIDGP
jgi:hypothetical protein